MKSTNPLNTDWAGTKGREGLVVPSKLALGAAAGSLEVRGKPPVTVRGKGDNLSTPQPDDGLGRGRGSRREEQGQQQEGNKPRTGLCPHVSSSY